MKYILKYNVKSKYFHFTRELQKEFDDAVELYTFIRENNIKNYTLYKEINDTLNDKRIIKAIEKIESVRIYGLRSGKTLIATLLDDVLDILKGSDSNE